MPPFPPIFSFCPTLNFRSLPQVMRELDRERAQLERQEKKLVVDIKKMAKSGQMDAVKIMAKDLVRTRGFVKKFILMKANIQGIALKLQTLKSQAAMANAMKGKSERTINRCGKDSKHEGENSEHRGAGARDSEHKGEWSIPDDGEHEGEWPDSEHEAESEH